MRNGTFAIIVACVFLLDYWIDLLKLSDISLRQGKVLNLVVNVEPKSKVTGGHKTVKISCIMHTNEYILTLPE